MRDEIRLVKTYECNEQVTRTLLFRDSAQKQRTEQTVGKHLVDTSLLIWHMSFESQEFN